MAEDEEATFTAPITTGSITGRIVGADPEIKALAEEVFKRLFGEGDRAEKCMNECAAITDPHEAGGWGGDLEVGDYTAIARLLKAIRAR